MYEHVGRARLKTHYALTCAAWVARLQANRMLSRRNRSRDVPNVAAVPGGSSGELRARRHRRLSSVGGEARFSCAAPARASFCDHAREDFSRPDVGIALASTSDDVTAAVTHFVAVEIRPVESSSRLRLGSTTWQRSAIAVVWMEAVVDVSTE